MAGCAKCGRNSLFKTGTGWLCPDCKMGLNTPTTESRPPTKRELDIQYLKVTFLPFIAGIVFLLIGIVVYQYRSNAKLQAIQRENGVFRANQSLRNL